MIEILYFVRIIPVIECEIDLEMFLKGRLLNVTNLYNLDPVAGLAV